MPERGVHIAIGRVNGLHAVEQRPPDVGGVNQAHRLADGSARDQVELPGDPDVVLSVPDSELVVRLGSLVQLRSEHVQQVVPDLDGAVIAFVYLKQYEQAHAPDVRADASDGHGILAYQVNIGWLYAYPRRVQAPDDAGRRERIAIAAGVKVDRPAARLPPPVLQASQHVLK